MLLLRLLCTTKCSNAQHILKLIILGPCSCLPPKIAKRFKILILLVILLPLFKTVWHKMVNHLVEDQRYCTYLSPHKTMVYLFQLACDLNTANIWVMHKIFITGNDTILTNNEPFAFFHGRCLLYLSITIAKGIVE